MQLFPNISRTRSGWDGEALRGREARMIYGSGNSTHNNFISTFLHMQQIIQVERDNSLKHWKIKFIMRKMN